ncbi:hypothetical protein BGZ46_007025 [Entomortierella lignicola]|nr:hypothetical protein BGZ46_007025 [Entomortierella lignicola]
MPVPTPHALHPSEQNSHPPISPEAQLQQHQQRHIDTALSQTVSSSLFKLGDIATSPTLLPKTPNDSQQSKTTSGTSDYIHLMMKTDRKADPSTASVPVKSSTGTVSSASHQSNNNSHSSTKKRKAATGERRTYATSGGLVNSTDATSLEDQVRCHTAPPGSVSDELKKKRASIDEHTFEEEGDYVVEVSGNMRKKRVLATPRTNTRHHHPRGQVHATSSEAEPEEEEEIDVDTVMEDEDPLKKSSSKVNLSTLDSSTKRKGGVTAATKATSNGTTNSKKASKSSISGNDSENGVTTTVNAKAIKAPRQSVVSNSSSPITSSTAPSSSEPKTQKLKPKNATPPTVSPSPSVVAATTTEPNLQKRVLPSRGRDKAGGIPIELSLLEPTPAPAGEYILYLANSQVFARTTIDPNRILPATYNGGSEEPETHQTALLSEPSTSSLGNSVKAVISDSAPPLSAVTHIEVPIFKPCTIGQFLQEEKKRQMQLLSKALAKAEAAAAAEARTNASSTAPARIVSTRQKHKEIVHSQPVSVQTAAPSSSPLSSIHGRKAMTTNTTLGKIEGVSISTTQEEILTDEVYEKRHRKQEMAEKKVKNREKEKLRHAMYQQQLVVEKLRHIEINRLMPISAFRSLQKTVEQEQQLHKENSGTNAEDSTAQAPISLAAARIMQDEYHRRLLREAEENLRRYEQLGLGENSNSTSAPVYSSFSRTKNRLAAMTPILIKNEQKISAPGTNIGGKIADKQEKKEKSTHNRSDSTVSASKSSSAEGRIRKKVKTNLLSNDDGSEVTKSGNVVSSDRSKSKPASKNPPSQKSSSVSSTSTVKTEEPPRPPKPITTFIKPGSILPSGARKSCRVALAFGEKVPILDRIDFNLPLAMFGDLIRERVGEDVLPTVDVKKKGSKAAATPITVVALNSAKGRESTLDDGSTPKSLDTISSSSSTTSSSSQSTSTTSISSLSSPSTSSLSLSQSKST